MASLMEPGGDIYDIPMYAGFRARRLQRLREWGITPKEEVMADKQASIGRIVHFVYGDKHVPAIIIDPEVFDADSKSIGQGLQVFTMAHSFTTVSDHDPDTHAPATWHWPERVGD